MLSVMRTCAVGAVTTVVAGLVGMAFWTVARPSWEVVSVGAPAQPADLLLLVVTGVGMAVTAWLGLSMLLSVLATLPGVVGAAAQSVAAQIAPTAVRRGATLLVGAVLSAGALPAANAADNPPSPTTTSWPGSSAVLTGESDGARAPLAPAPDPAFAVTGAGLPRTTWSPTTAVTSPTGVSIDGRTSHGAASTGPNVGGQSGANVGPVVDPGFGPTAPKSAGPPAVPSLGPLAQGSRTAAATHTPVIVMRGDSLWAIAARHLGPGATTAQIAGEWPRWYAANRQVIGADPNLILVGQVLEAPAAAAGGGGR